MNINKNLVDKSGIKLRALVAGLLFDCPLGGNPNDCFLCEQRKLSYEERLDILHELSNDDVVKIYEKHINCLCNRDPLIKNMY